MRVQEMPFDGFVITHSLRAPYVPDTVIETVGEISDYLIKNNLALIAITRTHSNCFVIVV